MKNIYAKVPNAQLNRIVKLDWDNKQLSGKDLELIFALAFIKAKKKVLSKKEVLNGAGNHRTRVREIVQRRQTQMDGNWMERNRTKED